jgi:hypothetical protein
MKAIVFGCGLAFVAALALCRPDAAAQTPKGKGKDLPQRTPAQRATSANNLKQMALAIHNFEAANGFLPSAILDPKTRKPILSWRVAILPYVEQDQLYKQFSFEEPWDGPNNKKLLASMPKLFLLPGVKTAAPKTHYRAFANGGAIFDYAKRVTLATIADGTSNTLLVAEADEAVDWTKPDELEYDAGKPVPKLGGLFQGGFLASLADGSVRTIPATLPEKDLRALITRAGGERVDPRKF